MITLTPTAMRRFASTFFVFLALLVACVGVNAMPATSVEHAAAVEHAQHGLTLSDLPADDLAGDDQDRLPSLEDNNNGLDDTFDVPSEHGVIVIRQTPIRPAGLVPPPHAHHPSLELRPPIV